MKLFDRNIIFTKPFRTTLLYAILISALSTSTNEIYSSFTKDLSKESGFTFFNLFALLTTIFIISRKKDSDDKRYTFGTYANFLFKQNRVVWYCIAFFSISTMLTFGIRLTYLKETNPFVFVSITLLSSLVEITIGSLIFKEKIANLFWFVGGLTIATVGIVLFTNESGKSGVVPSVAIMSLFFLSGTISENLKTFIRRKFSLNPEMFTTIPFLTSTVLGLAYILTCNLRFPNFHEWLTLAYIGIVPTAIVAFEIQKLKDTPGVGILSIKAISFASPFFILITQGIIFLLVYLIPQLIYYVTLREKPTLFQVLFSLIIITGSLISIFLDKPDTTFKNSNNNKIQTT